MYHRFSPCCISALAVLLMLPLFFRTTPDGGGAIAIAGTSKVIIHSMVCIRTGGVSAELDEMLRQARAAAERKDLRCSSGA